MTPQIIEEVKEVIDQMLDEEKLRVVGDACLKLLKNSTTRMMERESMCL